MGKEKGYVLYDEVSEVIPGDLAGGSEIDDVLAGLDVAGIEILEEPKDFEKKIEEAGEDLIDLELPAGIGEKVNDPMQNYLSDIYTITGDLAGIPCMSVPCGLTAEGLPVGLQILTRHFDESTMFRIADAYEKASN